MSTLVKEIEQLDCGRYYLTLGELQALVDEYGAKILNDSVAMFKAGFIKGQRAERAKQKKGGVA